MPDVFEHEGRRIAYNQVEGTGPGLVFLGGFRSDMEGTKALDLEDWAGSRGRAFLRFDYSGHGESSGDFLEGSIGDWAADARALVSALTDGPQVLVGSSMGGWISLILAKAIPEKIAGLVTVAAAPDFTEDGYWASFDKQDRMRLETQGYVSLENEYSDEPYIITKRLIDEGRQQLVLRDPLALPFPVRCLQGTEDTAVETATALRLLEHADCADMRLTLVKGADHRFSDTVCLGLIRQSIEEVLQAIYT